MSTIKKAFKSFSSTIVEPVFYLAIVGILLSISVIFTFESMPAVLKNIGTLVNAMMNSAVIGNLPLILCVGLAGGFAKKKKSLAALLGVIVYLMFIYANHAYLEIAGLLIEDGAAGMGLFGTGQTIVLGLQVTDINVIGGMALGCITGYVYNKCIDVRFPEFLGIYGGPRFALLVMSGLTMIISVAAAYIWPPIAHAIGSLAALIKTSGGIGVFLYGFLNRFLIPTGLHHFMWMPFMYTEMGGSEVINGITASGAQNIFYAHMADYASGAITAADPSIRYLHLAMSKEFTALGIALAFVKTAKKENRKAVLGMVMPVYLVAALSGITESYDFMVLLASPILWTLYGLSAGITEMLLYYIGSQVNNTYGFIELLVLNLPLPLSFTKIYIWIIFGIVSALITYFIAVFLIQRFNIMTPGRSEDWADEIGDSTDAVPTKEDVWTVITGLGGVENIENATHCITRFRATVKDLSKVDQSVIKKTPQRGVIVNGNEVHVVIGVHIGDFYDIAKQMLKLEE